MRELTFEEQELLEYLHRLIHIIQRERDKKKKTIEDKRRIRNMSIEAKRLADRIINSTSS